MGEINKQVNVYVKMADGVNRNTKRCSFVGYFEVGGKIFFFELFSEDKSFVELKEEMPAKIAHKGEKEKNRRNWYTRYSQGRHIFQIRIIEMINGEMVDLKFSDKAYDFFYQLLWLAVLQKSSEEYVDMEYVANFSHEQADLDMESYRFIDILSSKPFNCDFGQEG